MNGKLSLGDVSGSFTREQVDTIVLDMTNAIMFAHSHDLDRLALRKLLGTVKAKHGLNYR